MEVTVDGRRDDGRHAHLLQVHESTLDTVYHPIEGRIRGQFGQDPSVRATGHWGSEAAMEGRRGFDGHGVAGPESRQEERGAGGEGWERWGQRRMRRLAGLSVDYVVYLKDKRPHGCIDKIFLAQNDVALLTT